MATKRTVRRENGSTKTARPARAKSRTIVEPKSVTRPEHDEIALRAYQIWLANGCPEGESQKHWCEAESQLVLGI